MSDFETEKVGWHFLHLTLALGVYSVKVLNNVEMPMSPSHLYLPFNYPALQHFIKVIVFKNVKINVSLYLVLLD